MKLGCYGCGKGGRRKRTNRRGNRKTMRGGQVTSIYSTYDGGRRRRTMRGGQCGNHGCVNPAAGGRRKSTNRRGNRRTMRGGQSHVSGNLVQENE